MARNRKKELNKVEQTLADAPTEKFTEILVIGIDEDNVPYIHASIPTFAFVHWMLNRTLFEANMLENQQTTKMKQQRAMEEALASTPTEESLQQGVAANDE